MDRVRVRALAVAIASLSAAMADEVSLLRNERLQALTFQLEDLAKQLTQEVPMLDE